MARCIAQSASRSFQNVQLDHCVIWNANASWKMTRINISARYATIQFTRNAALLCPMMFTALHAMHSIVIACPIPHVGLIESFKTMNPNVIPTRPVKPPSYTIVSVVAADNTRSAFTKCMMHSVMAVL